MQMLSTGPVCTVNRHGRENANNLTTTLLPNPEDRIVNNKNFMGIITLRFCIPGPHREDKERQSVFIGPKLPVCASLPKYHTDIARKDMVAEPHNEPVPEHIWQCFAVLSTFLPAVKQAGQGVHLFFCFCGSP